MRNVIGLFDHHTDADRAMNELLVRGFDRDDISLVVREQVVREPAAPVAPNTDAGFTGGAAVGGLAGLMVGLGALAIPGIGPVIATGSLGTTLLATATGAALGGVTGGLLGALLDLGIPQEEAYFYVEGVKRGGVLLVVRADDECAPEALNIMHSFNAVDMESRGAESRRNGTQRNGTQRSEPRQRDGSARR